MRPRPKNRSRYCRASHANTGRSFVRLLDERLEFGCRERTVDDRHLDGEFKPAGFARTYRNGASHRGARRILLVVLGDEVERAAETGGVAGREQMLGRCRAGLAGTAHLLANGQVDADASVGRLAMAVAPAGVGGGRRDERLDLRNHDGLLGPREKPGYYARAARRPRARRDFPTTGAGARSAAYLTTTLVPKWMRL